MYRIFIVQKCIYQISIGVHNPTYCVREQYIEVFFFVAHFDKFLPNHQVILDGHRNYCDKLSERIFVFPVWVINRMDDPKVNASQDAVVDMEGDLTLSQEAQNLFGDNNSEAGNMNVTDIDESEELDQTKADESQPALNNSSDLGAKKKRRRKKKSESHPTNSASTLKLVRAVESTPALPTSNANPEKSARNRSKSRRHKARLTNQGLLAPGTPKRPREVGATPPSIEQLTKRPVASSSSNQSLAGSSTAQPNIATTLGTPDSVTNRLIGLKNSLQQKQLTDG